MNYVLQHKQFQELLFATQTTRELLPRFSTHTRGESPHSGKRVFARAPRVSRTPRRPALFQRRWRSPPCGTSARRASSPRSCGPSIIDASSEHRPRVADGQRWMSSRRGYRVVEPRANIIRGVDLVSDGADQRHFRKTACRGDACYFHDFVMHERSTIVGATRGLHGRVCRRGAGGRSSLGLGGGSQAARFGPELEPPPCSSRPPWSQSARRVTPQRCSGLGADACR